MDAKELVQDSSAISDIVTARKVDAVSAGIVKDDESQKLSVLTKREDALGVRASRKRDKANRTARAKQAVPASSSGAEPKDLESSNEYAEPTDTKDKALRARQIAMREAVSELDDTDEFEGAQGAYDAGRTTKRAASYARNARKSDAASAAGKVEGSAKRASARSISAVIAHYGYARQDRKTKPRDPISAKLVANLITRAGADRVLTMDLHANQIQGFFDIPVDNLLGSPIFVNHFMTKYADCHQEVMVVSPDVGSVARARAFAQKLDMPLAIVDKRRQKANSSEVMNIIGDVRDKRVILLDDMVDTGGSLCGAAKALVEVGGAKSVTACASHGVLSGPAIQRIEDSVLDEVIFLDTIPARPEVKCAKIKYLSVAEMFAEAIERIYEEISVSKLFN